MSRFLLVLLGGCFYVTEAERAARWDLDGDGVERPADCDDADPHVAAQIAFHPDTDGDGFGDAARSTRACAAPSGFVADGTDCDDRIAAVHPGADEVCDGLDDDCDGATDEDLPVVSWYRDADGDGFGTDADPVEGCAPPDGYVAESGDCDDTDEGVHPGATEVCDDGVDDDCANGADEDDPNVVLDVWHTDGDGDGFGADDAGTATCTGPTGTVDNALDCDDGNPDVNPDAIETCNGVDDDCEGTIDVGVTDASVQRFYRDTDGDGYGDASAPVDACPPPSGDLVTNPADCDDGDATIHPGVPDCQDGGVDNDCDGTPDEDPC